MSRRFLVPVVCSMFLLAALPSSGRASTSQDTRAVCEWLLLQEATEQQILPSLEATVDSIGYRTFSRMFTEGFSDSAMMSGMAAGLREFGDAADASVVTLDALSREYESQPVLFSIRELIGMLQETASAVDQIMAVIQSAPGDHGERLRGVMISPEFIDGFEQMRRTMEALGSREPPEAVLESARELLRDAE